MRFAFGVLALVACARSNSVTCDNGLTCPSETVCDLVHGGCVLPHQLETCVGIANGMSCTIDSASDGVCDRDVCLAKRCGDGYVTDTEQCDLMATSALSCQNFGFYDNVKPPCTSACQYDLTQCTGFCGDTMVTGPEICEPTIAPTQTCLDYGYGAGPLGCASCGPDFTNCETLGWTVIDLPGGSMLDIHGLADDDIYGMAFDGLYHFDGAAWSKVNVGSCDVSSLRYVHQASPGVVFATAGSGGNLGQVVRIENGTCSSWKTAGGSVITGVFATSASNAWVTSDLNGNGIWHLEGSSWTQSDNRAARAIWGTSEDDVYAALVASPYLIRYDGNAWAPVAGYPSTMLPSPRAIWGTSSTDIYIAGLNGSTPVLLRYNGSSFTQVAGLSAFPIQFIFTGWSVGQRTVIEASVLNSSAGLILEHDGVGWTDLRTPSGSTAGPLWMSPTGRVNAGFSGGAKMLRLDRNGLIRTPSAWSGGAASSMQARAQNDVLLATSGGGVQRFNGATWSSVSSINTFFDTTMDPSGNMFAISFQAGLLRPSGPGSWTVDPTPTGNALAAVATNDVWILDGTSRGITRWVAGQMSPPPSITGMLAANEYISDLWGDSPSNVYAVSGAGKAYRFDGQSWTVAWSVSEPLYTLWGVPGPAGSAVTLYAGTTKGTLVRYDGANVTSIPLPATMIHAIWGKAENDLFVATDKSLLHFDGTQWSPTEITGPHTVISMTGAGDSVFFADYARNVTQLVRTGSWSH